MKINKKNTFQAGLAFLSLVLLVVYFSGCSSDESAPDTLAGQYQLNKATVSENVTVDVGGIPFTVLPKGTDMTNIVKKSLFSFVACSDSTNAAVELKDDKSMNFICYSESVTPVPGGTWSENSDLTVLTLNLSSAILPPSGLTLPVQNVTLSGSILSGSLVNLPLPESLLEDYLQGQSIPGGVLAVSLDVEFKKL